MFSHDMELTSVFALSITTTFFVYPTAMERSVNSNYFFKKGSKYNKVHLMSMANSTTPIHLTFIVVIIRVMFFSYSDGIIPNR